MFLRDFELEFFKYRLCASRIGKKLEKFES